MSLLSGTNSSANKKLMGYFPQSSIYGACIPVIYGTMRTTGNIINAFGWASTPATAGGKGGGKGSSGKDGGDFNYATGFIEGVCMGPVEGILTIWLDRTIYKVLATNERITVPGSGIYTASNPGFLTNNGVSQGATFSTTVNDYGSPGSTTISGTQNVPLVQVSGTPGPGQYSVAAGVYTFNAADIGVTVDIGYYFTAYNGSAITPPVFELKFDLFLGSQGQSAWSYGTPGLTPLGYTQLAYVAIQSYPLGTSGMIPNFSFEVAGKQIFPGAGIADCDPIAGIFADFIVSAAYGPNWNPALLGSLTEASSYCVANSIFCSGLYDSQRSAASWLEELLTIANAEAVWSDATLKLRSRGDTTAVSNGVTFTPTTQPIYDLDDDDFIAKPGEEPVEYDLPTAQDAYNSIKVEWTNRGNGYQPEPIPAQDDYAIQLYGIREASQISLHGITEQAVAARVAQVQLKKLVYERGTAKFTLGMHYCLLEPMDMVTVTDLGLGFIKQPFRISTIEEDEQGQLAIEAIIFPWSISQPTLHPKQTLGGYSPAYSAQPGSVNAPLFFEATQEMTQQIGLVIFILLSGGPNWGGCSVYESSDNITYDYVARHTARSSDGVLTATLPWSADPDTTDTLSVDLVQSIGALESYSQAQADKFQSLALVDQELVAYTTATLGAGYRYALTGYLRRGLFGTNITEHFATAPFAALDGTEFQDSYQTTDIGKTRWYKFTSFNLAGQQEEDISTVTPYPWSILAPYMRGPLAYKPYAEEYFFAPSNFSFRLAQIQGTAGAQSVAISAAPLVNLSSQAVTAPVSDAVASVTIHTGNVLTAGQWIAQVFAVDSAGAYGPGSGLTAFTITGPAFRASFNILLPSGTSQYEVFIGRDLDTLYGQGIQSGAPAVINIDSMNLAGYGPPDKRAFAWHATGRRVTHGGIASAVVASSAFGTPSTVVIGVPGAAVSNEYAGRYLIAISKAGLPTTQDFSVIPIAASDTGSSLCTLQIAIPPTVGTGDLVLIGLSATAATLTSITDTGLISPFAPNIAISAATNANPVVFTVSAAPPTGQPVAIASFTGGWAAANGTFIATNISATTFSIPVDSTAFGAISGSPVVLGGLTPHAEIGQMIKVFYDPTGSAVPGDEVVITDNTSTSWSVTSFQKKPGVGTVFIEVESTLRANVVTAEAPNALAPTISSSSTGAVPLISIPAADLQGYVALVDLRAQDADGNDSPETGDSTRMMWIVPNPIADVADGPIYLVPNIGNVFTPDLSNGLNQNVVLVADSIINTPINVPPGTSVTWTLIIDQDSAGGHNAQLPGYSFNSNILGTSLPGTRSQSNWITDQSGGTSLSGSPSTDQPIP
jgi:hypothetical protein